MDYEGIVKKVLEDAGADEGDLVEIEIAGRSFQGIVMPHHEFSGRDILTIKLENGYNIGLDLTKGASMKLIRKGEMPKIDRDVEDKVQDQACVSFISTGGTIASFVDYRTGAVHPALTSKELIFANPELTEHCDPRARVLFSVLSENMTPRNWMRLAEEVAKELNSGATGVVVPHGTDTMGFTAAALSFMLKDLSGPVVLVGSQRSSDRPSSDAHLNLLGAVALAKSDLGEVVVVMHDGPSDGRLAVHRGTKVRKMHSSRRDAFRSMNMAPLGHVVGEEVELAGHRRRAKGPVRVENRLEERVALLYFHPGMNPGLVLDVLKHEKGLVLAGTGLGHVSTDIIEVLRDLETMKPVVMTTQCLEGTVDLEVYSSGRDLMDTGVILGGDMLPETAYVKLMWVLGQTQDLEEVRRMMTTDVAGELGRRRLIGGGSEDGR
jgi:glutamyl-tRNA(Gln) amidotransferase subunit D